MFAYEPQRIVFYQLCGNVFLNRLENVRAFHVAIGAADGTVDLPEVDYYATVNAASFTLDPHAAAQQSSVRPGTARYAVDLRRLDSIAFPKAPALIKIDVEGFELDVLEGAPTLLREPGFPPLLLEAWTATWFAERRAALLRHLEGLGYASFLLGEEIIAQHPDHPRHFEFALDPASGLRMTRVR